MHTAQFNLDAKDLEGVAAILNTLVKESNLDPLVAVRADSRSLQVMLHGAVSCGDIHVLITMPLPEEDHYTWCHCRHNDLTRTAFLGKRELLKKLPESSAPESLMAELKKAKASTLHEVMDESDENEDRVLERVSRKTSIETAWTATRGLVDYSYRLTFEKGFVLEVTANVDKLLDAAKAMLAEHGLYALPGTLSAP